MVDKTLHRKLKDSIKGMWVMMVNATSSNISLISWQSVLLVEETTDLPAASH